MKKWFLISVVWMLCAALCAGSASACLVPYSVGRIPAVGTDVQIVSEAQDSVTIRKSSDAPFKVLLFTDMHLAAPTQKHPGAEHAHTIREMVENIRREKPDLVLLGGDNVTSGFNYLRSHQLCRIFEKLGVYWGGVLGNHEGDNMWSIRRSTMVKVFSAYPHCLLRPGKADVEGNCNYVIRILNKDGSLKQAIVCLDSFDEMPDELKVEHGFDPSDSVYDVIRPSQIAWYNEQIRSMKQEYGKCPSMVLLHIPLTQYADAATLVEAGELQYCYGDRLETINCAGYDSGLFDAILDGGSTKAVFCGHDHVNTFGVLYKGILLSYIEPSGYGAYGVGNKFGDSEDGWLQGCTRLLLADDGTFIHDQLRNSALK